MVAISRAWRFLLEVSIDTSTTYLAQILFEFFGGFLCLPIIAAFAGGDDVRYFIAPTSANRCHVIARGRFLCNCFGAVEALETMLFNQGNPFCVARRTVEGVVSFVARMFESPFPHVLPHVFAMRFSLLFSPSSLIVWMRCSPLSAVNLFVSRHVASFWFLNNPSTGRAFPV